MPVKWSNAAVNFLLFSCSPTESQMGSAFGSYGSTPHTFPNFHHPSHELLQDNGFVWHVYHKYHSKCLKGKCYGIATIAYDCLLFHQQN